MWKYLCAECCWQYFKSNWQYAKLNFLSVNIIYSLLCIWNFLTHFSIIQRFKSALLPNWPLCLSKNTQTKTLYHSFSSLVVIWLRWHKFSVSYDRKTFLHISVLMYVGYMHAPAYLPPETALGDHSWRKK